MTLSFKKMFHFFCFVDNLLIDYQFTFSLLQEDDRYYTAINFMATPEQVNPGPRNMFLKTSGLLYGVYNTSVWQKY